MSNSMTNNTQNDTQEIYKRLNGRNMIAIASGKGGVGKTWLTITLAHAFAQAGQKVLLVDGDLGLANVDIQLGLNALYDLSGVLNGKIPMNKAVVYDENIGCDVLAGHTGSQAMTGLSEGQLQLLRDDLYMLAPHYDYVFIDLGTGISKSMSLLAGYSGTVLIMCTDEPTSLSDAYTFIKILSEQPQTPKMRIVVNFANTQKEGDRTFQTLSKACQNFLNIDLVLGGILHQDSAVKECIKAQIPLLTSYMNTIIAKDVIDLAKQLMQEK